MAMTFLSAVNRLLRINGFIRGDTDLISAFTDTNHNSTSNIAQIAIQTDISGLTALGVLPYQHTEQASLVLLAGTRVYTYPTDFVQMWGHPPFFYDTNQNNHIYEYPGGEDSLRDGVYTYRTQSGYPQYFYFILSTLPKVAFYPVPDASVNNRSLSYDYQASVNVSIETDNLPFATVDQQYAFCDMTSRRFKFLYEGKTDVDIDKDKNFQEARSRLFSLLKAKAPAQRYGVVYRGGADRWSL